MNKNQTIQFGSLLLLLTVLASLSSCATKDNSVHSSVLGTESEQISALELHNTIWLSPLCGMPSENQYENEGFFLAEDGSVLFVNIFSMTGDSWNLEGNDLTLYSHTERYPEAKPVNYSLIKKDGISSIKPVEGETEMIQPSAHKITPQIPEGRWLLSTMLNPENAAADPEQRAYIELVQNEDGSMVLQGHGSVNNFRAFLTLENFDWETGPMMRTLMAGPALEYEDLFMKNLDQINRYLYLDDFLFLYNETELLLVMHKELI